MHSQSKQLTFPSCADFAILIRRVFLPCMRFACSSAPFSTSSPISQSLAISASSASISLHSLPWNTLYSTPLRCSSKSLVVFLLWTTLLSFTHSAFGQHNWLRTLLKRRKKKLKLGTISTNTAVRAFLVNEHRLINIFTAIPTRGAFLLPWRCSPLCN